jgi:hypothetical protein
MKTVLCYIWSVLESLGKARAAAHLARRGDYDRANRIMSK